MICGFEKQTDTQSRDYLIQRVGILKQYSNPLEQLFWIIHWRKRACLIFLAVRDPTRGRSLRTFWIQFTKGESTIRTTLLPNLRFFMDRKGRDNLTNGPGGLGRNWLFQLMKNIKIASGIPSLNPGYHVSSIPTLSITRIMYQIVELPS